MTTLGHEGQSRSIATAMDPALKGQATKNKIPPGLLVPARFVLSPVRASFFVARGFNPGFMLLTTRWI